MAESDSLRRAKQPRSLVAGPYGHPFHPIAVTIPIGAWTASVVFDLLGFFAEDPEPFALGAQVLIAIGIVGAIVAAVLGFLDYSVIPRGTRARRTALIHMLLNLGAIVLFAVNWAVRAASDHDEVSVAGFVLTLIGLGALGISGWLGGKLAYHYGVRVATEETQREGF